MLPRSGGLHDPCWHDSGYHQPADRSEVSRLPSSIFGVRKYSNGRAQCYHRAYHRLRSPREAHSDDVIQDIWVHQHGPSSAVHLGLQARALHESSVRSSPERCTDMPAHMPSTAPARCSSARLSQLSSRAPCSSGCRRGCSSTSRTCASPTRRTGSSARRRRCSGPRRSSGA